MTDESKDNPSSGSDPIAKEVRKLQETYNPLAKTIAEAMAKAPKIPQINLSPPPIPLQRLLVDQNLASEFYRRLTEWVSEFDKALDQEHEVGVCLVNFGQTVTFQLVNIGYWNPSLISFSGFTDNGDPVELIQHVTQISVLLTKLKRKDLTNPKKPIGFAPPAE